MSLYFRVLISQRINQKPRWMIFVRVKKISSNNQKARPPSKIHSSNNGKVGMVTLLRDVHDIDVRMEYKRNQP